VNGLCGAHPSKEAGHERDVRDVHKVVAGRLRSDVLTDWGLRYGLPEIPRQSGDISDVGEVVVVEVDRPGVGATGQVRVGTDVALESGGKPDDFPPCGPDWMPDDCYLKERRACRYGTPTDTSTLSMGTNARRLNGNPALF